MCFSIVNADNQRGVVVCVFPLFALLVSFFRHVQFNLPKVRFEKPGKTLYSGV